MKFESLIDEPCSISRSLAVLGDRWTLVVLKQAFAGTRRFDDFVAAIGIPRGRLADRLGRLVDHGLLVRVDYVDRRTRQEYRLTDVGMATYPILMALRAWGDDHLSPEGPPLRYRHDGCRGTAEVHLRCSACADELTARDVVVETGPGWPDPT